MRYKGKSLSGPNIEYIVIPRGDDSEIVFKAQAVLDMKPFRAMVPEPKPGKKMLPGGRTVDDDKDAGFLAEQTKYGKLRYAYILLNSLSITEDLEWETIKLDQPETWLDWEKELEDSGFSFNEIQLIQIGVANANGLNQMKLNEARARFLAFQQQVQEDESSSQTDVQQNTQSGEPAKE